MAKRSIVTRNKTESVDVMVRFPPGWIAAIRQLAESMGESQNYAIKESVRLMIMSELGVELQHRAPGQRDWPAAEEHEPQKKPARKSKPKHS